MKAGCNRHKETRSGWKVWRGDTDEDSVKQVKLQKSGDVTIAGNVEKVAT